MSIYCFDLDHTICVPNEASDTEARYGKALPIQAMIDKIIALKTRGHTIIIHTARRMVTHNGNIAKVVMDVGDITVEWLKEHGVPYDDLIFGKPYADHYVDDKAMKLEEVPDV